MSSGIDLALAFVSSVSGRGVAGKVQLMIEYFPPQVGLGGFIRKVLRDIPILQENYADRSLVDQLPTYRRGGGDKQELPEYLKDSYFK